MPQAVRSLPRPVLFAIGLGTFLAQLDGTVMNVALPALSRAFHTPNLSAVQPVITAYLVASVALLPLLGKLADRLGRKRLFLAGFVLFGLASLLCSLAGSLDTLIALRIVQAVGGALLSGTSLALVAAYSGENRGESLGKLALVFALSGLLGPPLGGALIQAFGWQAVFWLNVPLVVLGLALGVRLLPPDSRHVKPGQIDLPGAALFALGTAMLAAGLGTASALTLFNHLIGRPIPIVLGLVSYAALVGWEVRAGRRKVDALLDLPLLRTPAYGLGLCLAFLSNGVTVALFVVIPFWLSKGWHADAGTIGLIFLPVAVGLGGLAPIAGKRSDSLGARALTTGGMLIAVVAATLLALEATHLLWPVLVLAMLGLGASSGLFGSPNNNAVLSSAPESALALAGSMLSTARTLGVILGVSTAGALFDALRGGQGTNSAARILFFGAAALYAVNAVLCWTVRSATPAGRVVPSMEAVPVHKQPATPERLRSAR